MLRIRTPETHITRSGRDGRRSFVVHPFNELTNLLTAIRWGTIVVGGFIAVSRTQLLDDRIIGVVVALISYALIRTVRPVRRGNSRTAFFFAIAFEVFLSVACVNVTGYWNSPFAGALIFPIIAAGFAASWLGAFSAALISAIAVGIPFIAWHDGSLASSLNWTIELFLVAALSAYARRLFWEAQHRASVALSRVQQLSQANALLYELNQVAQTLPASLDFRDTIDTTITRLRELLPAEQITITMLDNTNDSWVIEATIGGRLEDRYAETDLPHPVQMAIASGLAEASITNEPGFYADSQCLLLAPLISRDVLVGFITLESKEPEHFHRDDREILSGFAEQASLALDNARFFERLRFVGADQERTRLARDLHDRVGQSLAFVTFELERLARTSHNNEVRTDLETMRDNVRKATSEIRETLYDLRSEVSDQRTFGSLLEEFADRVRARSQIEVEQTSKASDRLPLQQERELWRIAQEAIVNAERHAQCKKIMVSWRCDEKAAVLIVEDDGVGFVPGHDGRDDSYGLTGMRERANAIGATLRILSPVSTVEIPESTAGTRVECKLERI